MKRNFLGALLCGVAAMSLAACGGEAAPQAAATITVATAAAQPTPATGTNKQVENSVPPTSTVPNTAGQDQHITVQHILIGFKDAAGFQGKAPAKAQARTQEDAKKLAYEILDKAKKGDDFDALVKEYTDDSPPGIYSMSNIGVQPGGRYEFGRAQMVPAFGNIGFALKVGEIGIADYSTSESPFGYHIIKRIATAATPTPLVKPAGQDDHISVQHILVGFKDAVGFRGNAPAKAQTRTQEDAKKLAYEILDKAKKGTDFDQLVKDNTDDSPPGIYGMANFGATPTSAQEAPREGMVPAFGNVGFALKVGEIGIADYDPTTSPFGYHIIKRVK